SGSCATRSLCYAARNAIVLVVLSFLLSAPRANPFV
ncbi:hypothetical protein A2U01_0099961, partial [Trifolium medium]|nr:hypothetical protein [Trifolium medium]